MNYLKAELDRVLVAKHNWLEDIIAGLLINGVHQTEIEIKEWPNCRTTVAVRGADKYEFKIKGLDQWQR